MLPAPALPNVPSSGNANAAGLWNFLADLSPYGFGRISMAVAKHEVFTTSRTGTVAFDSLEALGSSSEDFASWVWCMATSFFAIRANLNFIRCKFKRWLTPDPCIYASLNMSQSN
jgi:hypothetical protein